MEEQKQIEIKVEITSSPPPVPSARQLFDETIGAKISEEQYQMLDIIDKELSLEGLNEIEFKKMTVSIAWCESKLRSRASGEYWFKDGKVYTSKVAGAIYLDPKGLFQFISSTWRSVNKGIVKDVYDPVENTKSYIEMYKTGRIKEFSCYHKYKNENL